MNKKQIILSLAALAAVVLLFNLPKAVVDNEGRNNNLESRQKEAGVPATSGAGSAAPDAHTAQIPEAKQAEMRQLRENYESNAGSEKSITFANSLAEAYQSMGLYESAAYYADQVAGQTARLEDQQKAGAYYYEAFTHALDAAQANAAGEKARFYYEKVLAGQPDDLDAKTKIAMTYMSTASPMQGIKMLQEVLAEDENNELAIFNLGLLSMQSGQYKKAVERFEKLVAVNPDHLQGNYWLGVSYFEAGRKQKAKAQFEKVRSMDSDPEVQASIENYLQRM